MHTHERMREDVMYSARPYAGDGEEDAGWLTLEEFERLPEDPDGHKLELVRGMLVRERGLPDPPHARLQSRFAYLLERYHEERDVLGRVYVNGHFLLAVDPPTVRVPDVACGVRERERPRGDAARRSPFGPDLAVEVISPSNTWMEIQSKVDDYLGADVRLVWILDPRSRTCTVYRPGEAALRLEASGALEGGDVLPGLRIELSDLFRVLADD
jgi:Uma2 family endonuclease